MDPDYDPNTRHVIYGLDADLIMLSMATHEAYFRVLREDVFWEEQVKYNPCSFCGIKGHAADTCMERRKADPDFRPRPIVAGKPFIFLDVAVLREYLEAELKPNNPLPFRWDLERAIDDWIFMCFFVGNDFLPHLPSLEIREGAIDLLIDIYKSNLAKMGGFLCHHGQVDLQRVQVILEDLGKVEQQIFLKRREKEERRNENIKRRKLQEVERESRHSVDPKGSNMAVAQALKAQMRKDDEASEEAPDDVRLWEADAKDRYYLNKFHLHSGDSEAKAEIANAYVEGLCWVMAYYYQGCPSWKWFYPYHYAPFASDLVNIGSLKFNFELGQPFRPFDQLMGVFPADSRELVPEPFRRLMIDPSSEVIDFYPTDFDVDLNGKKQAWQGVILLPFIDETRLLEALEKVYPELDPQDRQMNLRGQDRVFFSLFHPACGRLLEALDDDRHRVPLDPQQTGGLAGYIQRDVDFPEPGETYESPLIENGCPSISDTTVACFIYYVPYHDRQHLRHKALLLPETEIPPRTLTPEDIHTVQSGLASRRVPGRLHIDRGRDAGGSSMSFGHHSMHQEYSRDFERRDGGYNRNYSPRTPDDRHRNHSHGREREYNRDYQSRDYSRNDRRGRDYRNERDYSPERQRHASERPSLSESRSFSSEQPASHPPRHLPPPANFNPFALLAPLPPPTGYPPLPPPGHHGNPTLSMFHRAPRPPLDQLYGRYPPPTYPPPSSSNRQD